MAPIPQARESTGKNSKVPIRLWRWFVIHVLFALVPLLAPLVIPFLFYPYKGGQLGAGEVLLFSFMISSIAGGEVFELFFVAGFSNFRLLLGSVLGVSALISILLYGAIVNQNISGHRDGELIFWTSVVLAAIPLAVGTILEVTFWSLEKKLVNAVSKAGETDRQE